VKRNLLFFLGWESPIHFFLWGQFVLPSTIYIFSCFILQIAIIDAGNNKKETIIFIILYQIVFYQKIDINIHYIILC
jgi:hypothetical protein